MTEAGTIAIPLKELETNDKVIRIGKDYIPGIENQIRQTIYNIFQKGNIQEGEFSDSEMLSEAVFWSLGELINNANKANNRYAILRRALFKKARENNPNVPDAELLKDIDYAVEHNQTDLLKKYNLHTIDLTEAILKLLQTHKTNSFALSEKFQKRIEVTLRIREKSGQRILSINVINNSPMTVVDRKRVEYNLEKIKEDLINAGRDPFEAAVHLYDKDEDHGGGGFGAGLRSIVLFIKQAFDPFKLNVIYSRLIQYRTTSSSTIFSIELPIPD